VQAQNLEIVSSKRLSRMKNHVFIDQYFLEARLFGKAGLLRTRTANGHE